MKTAVIRIIIEKLLKFKIMDRYSLKTRAVYLGFGIGLLLNLLVLKFLKEDEIYTSNNWLTLLSIALISTGFICLFKKVRAQHANNRPSLRQLIKATLIFSITISICLGFGHYMNATYINPNWGQKSLDIAQERWAEKNYSEAAIASQIEWTDTFQNPIKWGLTLAVFFTLLLSLLGAVITLIIYVHYKLSTFNKNDNFSIVRK